MLLFAYVHNNVVPAGAFAHNFAFVYRHAGANEQAAAVLSIEKTVAVGFAGFAANKAAAFALLNISLIKLVAVEYMAHNAVAARIGKQFAAVSHKAAGRYVEKEPCAAFVFGMHINKFRLARTKLLHNAADVFARHVNGQFFDRLKRVPLLVLLQYHLGAGYCKFIILPAHLLYQYGKVQLAAAGYLERISRAGFLNAHGNIGFNFFHQPVAQVAAGNVFALLACKGAIVYHEHHGYGGFIYMHERHRLNAFGRAGGLAYRKIRNARNGYYIARVSFLNLNALQSFVAVKPAQLDRAHGVRRAAAHGDHLVAAGNTALHAAYAYAAHIVVVIYGGEQYLQRGFRVARRGGNGAYYRIEHGLHIRAEFVRLHAGYAFLGACINNGEVKLLRRCAKLHEQLQRLVHNLHRPCAGAVYLVNNNDGNLVQLQRLPQHEAGLRHTAFKCVNQQQHAVNHLQYALNLSAEVRMARRIYYVYSVILILYRGIFAEYGYAALPFQVAGVHHALLHLLVRPEYAALTQQAVHQRGLAVVNVGNYGNVTDIFLLHIF